MATANETICNLMLDALRRGILLARGVDAQHGARGDCESNGSKRSAINIVDLKKQMCQSVMTLTYDQKMELLLAVVHIAGYEAIGAHNNGCLVDITNWDAAKMKRLDDVIQFITK